MTCNPSPKRPDCHRQRAPQYFYPVIIKMIFCTTVGIGWTHSAMAQTQGFQSGDQIQSAAELGKQAANPLSAGWLMQTQQNNSWVGTPLNMGDRVQSDLLFQPLVNAKLTEDWTLFARPVLTLFNSTPFVNPSGHGERTTAFGDTVLAFAVAPRPFFGGHLTVAAGPTFIFPTASDHLLGQHTWQLGPDLGVVWSGKHFIAFVFPQQWFKIGGGSAKTNQLSTLWDFTYFFKNGWSIATEPNFLVNWQAPRNQRLTFPIGPQIGKLCKCDHTPTLFQFQFEYYPVHPSVYGPKWNIQLQITPTISPLIKRAIF
jgi:hypothetical protein